MQWGRQPGAGGAGGKAGSGRAEFETLALGVLNLRRLLNVQAGSEGASEGGPALVRSSLGGMGTRASAGQVES